MTGAGRDPTKCFNALSEEEKKRVLSDGLGASLLHSGLAFAMPLWWAFKNHHTDIGLRNGSAFLVDFGHGIFAVTACHVFREYLETKRTTGAIGCQLGSAQFDPEARLICSRDDLDIATFRVTASEAKQIDKAIVTASPANWEPLSPAAGDFAFFAGFPAQTRGMTSRADFVTAPYFAMPKITSVTDLQITCRFDREKIIDLSGSGLPPQGYDIGGASGGPMLMPTLVREGVVEGVVWRFAGVIVEAAQGVMFEQVVAVRSLYIQPDGQVG